MYGIDRSLHPKTAVRAPAFRIQIRWKRLEAKGPCTEKILLSTEEHMKRELSENRSGMHDIRFTLI